MECKKIPLLNKNLGRKCKEAVVDCSFVPSKNLYGYDEENQQHSVTSQKTAYSQENLNQDNWSTGQNSSQHKAVLETA
jgi:hypothetical protein